MLLVCLFCFEDEDEELVCRVFGAKGTDCRRVDYHNTGTGKKSIKYDLARHLGYMKQCNAVQACSSSMPVRPPIQDTQQVRGQRSVSFRARPKV